MKKKLRGSVYLLLATIIWGSTFVAQSVGMDYIGPFTFQAVRCFLAVLVLVPATLFFERKDLGNFIARWKDPQLWKAGLLCGGALFIAAGLQQVGLVYTDAGKAGFITALYIVIVPLIAIFLGRKPTVLTVISIVIAVAGMYLLCCAGASGIQLGDVLLLLCAFAFAVQITLIDRYVDKVDSLRLNCIQALVTAVLSGLFMPFETVDMGLILQCWLPICYAGIGSMGIAYTLQIVGQRHLDPTPASLLMSLESVFAVVFGALLLNETMTFWEACGCVLVFSAVILSQIPTKRTAC